MENWYVLVLYRLSEIVGRAAVSVAGVHVFDGSMSQLSCLERSQRHEGVLPAVRG